MSHLLAFPITNRGSSSVTVGIELEGDCVQLDPGDNCTIHIDLEGLNVSSVEVEVIDGLVLLYSNTMKELVKGGRSDES